MAQIIFLLLVVGLAWYGYRKFVSDAERLGGGGCTEAVVTWIRWT